jgi:hypothetical protein
MRIVIKINNFEYRESLTEIGFVSVIQFTFYSYKMSEYFNFDVRYFGMPTLCNHIEYRCNFNSTSSTEQFKYYNI